MQRFSRPHILAWLVTGLLSLTVFAGGPLVVVAMTNLLSAGDTWAVSWLIALLVTGLKVSTGIAVLLTLHHWLRRRSA